MAYWVTSRYLDFCSSCREIIEAGESVLLHPPKRYCRECGEDKLPEPLNGADSGRQTRREL